METGGTMGESSEGTIGETVRFGVLGCGVIGAMHASVISSLPEAELAAIADVRAARAGVRWRPSWQSLKRRPRAKR